MRRSPTECASAAARAWNHVLKSPESRARSGRLHALVGPVFKRDRLSSYRNSGFFIALHVVEAKLQEHGQQIL